MPKSSWKSLLIAILIPEAVGALAGFISGPFTRAQYTQLIQPPLAPPPLAFPIVWGILYLLMGVASWLVWRQHTPESRRALVLYAVQLVVNFLWPIAFFNLQWRLFAFFWLLLLIILVWFTKRAFERISPAAGWLMLPYLLWCCFAAYLNLGIYLLNN